MFNKTDAVEREDDLGSVGQLVETFRDEF